MPINFKLEQTIEFGAPNPELNDHFFDYSPDFVDRIPTEFDLQEVRFTRLGDGQDWKLNGLIEDIIYVCRRSAA